MGVSLVAVVTAMEHDRPAIFTLGWRTADTGFPPPTPAGPRV